MPALHQKFVDCLCWFQEPSQSMRLGQCTSSLYILTYIDEINNIFYVDKIRRNLHICSVSYKSLLREKVSEKS